MPLLAFPADDVIWTATLTATNADALYPVTNVKNNDPSDTFRSTTTSTVITITLAGNITALMLFLGNTNYTTGTLANASGLSASFVFPSRTTDGKARNGWLDLRGLGNTTDDVFTLTLSKSGTAKGELGRIVLAVDLQEPELVIQGAGPSPVFGIKRPGMVENVTRLGSTFRRASPTSARFVRASSIVAEFLTLWQQLDAECLGLNRGFLFIPDEDDNDAWFAQLTMKDLEWTVDIPDVLIPVSLTIEEISMGLPPSLA